MTTATASIDLNVFKDDKITDESDEDNNDPIEACKPVKRLVSALKYYSMLDLTNNKDHQNIFTRFIADVYKIYLDDYCHLVQEHNNLEDINTAMIQMKAFGSCDIFKCLFTTRHYSVDTKTKSVDGLFDFYTETFDSLHFYLLHLYECGVWIEKQNESGDNDSKNGTAHSDSGNYYHQEFARVVSLIEAEADANNYECLDHEFDRISRLIEEREHITAAFDRFKNNSRFSLISGNEQQDDSKTFMDNIYSYLSTIQQVRQDLLSNFVTYMMTEQYDTDSLQIDVSFVEEGNVHFSIHSMKLVEAITQFINATKLKSVSLNIGIIFYYWPKYKGLEEFDQNRNLYNINDHGGFRFADLYVEQKYANFKEEISCYKNFSMVQYEHLKVKINEFLKTETVKKTKVREIDEDAIQLEYEVEEDTMLSYYHLLCLLMYTDFTKLSRDFSFSFRSVYLFEPVASIKKRNQNYWWMSKGLRETVQLFGYNKEDDELSGPFYSASCAKFVFPSFELRLCSPISTSKQIEVATRSATRNGIVVQLNNNVHWSHNYLSGFPCFLWSRYKEEAEYLFFGGHYKIKIESVRIIDGTQGRCQNFEKYFTALSKLNSILDYGFASDVTEQERKVISSLLTSKLDEFDEYIVKTVHSFIANKTIIVLNYWALTRSYMDKELRDMIMYGMRSMDDGEDVFVFSEDKTNLFRKQLLTVFKNVQKVIIYTTMNNGKHLCPLSFVWLLSEIEEVSFGEIIIKGVWYRNEKPSWIDMIWKKTKNILIQKYNKKNLNIAFENTQNEKGYKQDCVVISKM